MKGKDSHIQTSIVFSYNDVIINAGVIFTGSLVWQLDNQIPDLIIGSIVFLIVIRVTLRIPKLAKV